MENNCLFCGIAKQIEPCEILLYLPTCYVIEDTFPVSKGHVLIIPNIHYVHWFDTTNSVKREMIQAADLMKIRLDALYKPDGYNLGLNCGGAAGQTIMHLHLHLIPRYHGDMADPRGGIRGVIPDKQKHD